MNQVEIGKFIAKCRKEKKLTQAQLAEKFNIYLGCIVPNYYIREKGN